MVWTEWFGEWFGQNGLDRMVRDRMVWTEGFRQKGLRQNSLDPLIMSGEELHLFWPLENASAILEWISGYLIKGPKYTAKSAEHGNGTLSIFSKWIRTNVNGILFRTANVVFLW